MTHATKISIEATVNSDLQKVWQFWNEPQHIVMWNSPSPDWHTPKASNDLRDGGKFLYRMEARDGSMGFDFSGEYTRIQLHKKIDYVLDDGRKVEITFSINNNVTHIQTEFEAENMNPLDMQRDDWQAILNNFKAYVESN